MSVWLKCVCLFLHIDCITICFAFRRFRDEERAWLKRMGINQSKLQRRAEKSHFRHNSARLSYKGLAVSSVFSKGQWQSEKRESGNSQTTLQRTVRGAHDRTSKQSLFQDSSHLDEVWDEVEELYDEWATEQTMQLLSGELGGPNLVQSLFRRTRGGALDKDLTMCKGCARSFKGLLKHLSSSKECADQYDLEAEREKE